MFDQFRNAVEELNNYKYDSMNRFHAGAKDTKENLLSAEPGKEVNDQPKHTLSVKKKSAKSDYIFRLFTKISTN